MSRLLLLVDLQGTGDRVLQHGPGEPFVLRSGGQVPEVEDLLRLLVRPDDHGDLMPLLRAVSHLLADRDGIREDLGADARGAQPRGHLECDLGTRARELRHEDRRRGARRAQPARLVHQGEQPVEADRCAHAGQSSRREQARQIVVPSARGHAAVLLPALDGRLEDDAGVVIEATRQAQVDRQAVPRHAGHIQHVEDRPEVGDPLRDLGFG
jgi:hypothetical protein